MNLLNSEKKHFALREYQVDALVKIYADLKIMPNVLLSAIMGAGKTVIACRLINRYFFESDKKFLVLCHKQELVEQFRKTFYEKTDIPDAEIGICCAGLKEKNINSRITIGTIQTFISKISRYDYADLMIIDEAHRVLVGEGSQYDQVIDGLRKNNPAMRILGITATPFRLGHGYIYGTKCVGKNLFPVLNHQIRYAELRDSGYLMPIEGKKAIDTGLENELDKADISKGDYQLDEVGEIMGKPVHIQFAKEKIDEYCQEFKHICVFCCTIKHAELVKEAIGDECTIVHSQLSDIERGMNMGLWLSGKKRIMASVNILIEGFDFPPLDCIVFARPTLSPVLYLQAVGRLLRISEKKERAFLLDLTPNTDKFGSDLDNIKIKIPKKAHTKECKGCGRVCQIHVLKCPDCWYVFPVEYKICPECGEAVHKAVRVCVCGYKFMGVDLREALKPELVDINTIVDMPEEISVSRVRFARHSKDGKPDSVRIEYHNHNPYKSLICSEWLCFDHGIYARKNAVKQWKKLTTDDSVPGSVDEALERIERVFITPEKITVKQEGQYKRIVDYIYDTIPF